MLSPMVTSKSNRMVFQDVVSRGNPNIITAAELDFIFPPHSNVVEICSLILEAKHLGRLGTCAERFD